MDNISSSSTSQPPHLGSVDETQEPAMVAAHTGPAIVSSAVFVVALILGLLGISACVGFITFNFMYRHVRVVKMGSPKINILVLIGCCLAYLSAILWGVEAFAASDAGAATIACRFRAWMVTFGFTLGYGGLLVKAWRVQKIFKRSPTQRVVIRDNLLFAFIGGFLLLDVVLLSIWQGVHPTNSILLQYWTHQASDNTPDPSQPPSRMYSYYTCTSAYGPFWLGACYLYKAAMLVYGSYLSWTVRAVTLPAMNDSLCIVLTTVAVTIGGGCVSAAVHYLTLWPSITCCISVAAIFIVATLTQCLLCIPKIILWRKYSEEESLKISMTPQTIFSTNQSFDMIEDEVSHLHSENKQLRRCLLEKEETITDLKDHVTRAKVKLSQLITDKNGNITADVGQMGIHIYYNKGNVYCQTPPDTAGNDPVTYKQCHHSNASSSKSSTVSDSQEDENIRREGTKHGIEGNIGGNGAHTCTSIPMSVRVAPVKHTDIRKERPSSKQHVAIARQHSVNLPLLDMLPRVERQYQASNNSIDETGLSSMRRELHSFESKRRIKRRLHLSDDDHVSSKSPHKRQHSLANDTNHPRYQRESHVSPGSVPSSPVNKGSSQDIVTSSCDINQALSDSKQPKDHILLNDQSLHKCNHKVESVSSRDVDIPESHSMEANHNGTSQSLSHSSIKVHLVAGIQNQSQPTSPEGSQLPTDFPKDTSIPKKHNHVLRSKSTFRGRRKGRVRRGSGNEVSPSPVVGKIMKRKLQVEYQNEQILQGMSYEQLMSQDSARMRNSLCEIAEDLDTAETMSNILAAHYHKFQSQSAPNSLADLNAIHDQTSSRLSFSETASGMLQSELPRTELEESIITSYDLDHDSDTYSYISNCMSSTSGKRRSMRSSGCVRSASFNNGQSRKYSHSKPGNGSSEESINTIANDQYYPPGYNKRKRSKKTWKRSRRKCKPENSDSEVKKSDNSQEQLPSKSATVLDTPGRGTFV